MIDSEGESSLDEVSIHDADNAALIRQQQSRGAIEQLTPAPAQPALNEPPKSWADLFSSFSFWRKLTCSILDIPGINQKPIGTFSTLTTQSFLLGNLIEMECSNPRVYDCSFFWFLRLKKSIFPWSLIPWPPSFLDMVRANPDLYGPFWITTTVVFLMAAAGKIL